MKRLNQIVFAILVLGLLVPGCKDDWEDHYNNIPETVNQNVWEVIKSDANLSMFVGYMEEMELDTLFEGLSSYTLFIPDNDAWNDYLLSDTVNTDLLEYHVSFHFIQSGNISGTEKIQMMLEKFAVFERLNNASLLDGIVIDFESPLYRNGKYYILSEVAKPRPNLFEYYAYDNPIFRNYITDLDSIVLDREKSRPLGYDENGNTVYDTVADIYNEFEDFYFPIREEFRTKTATIVFPRSEDYNAALDVMAQSLGDIYQDHSDIPVEWQNDILIPYLLYHGVFENSLSDVDFIKTGGPKDTLKLKNILGDSINIEYQVKDRFECSNGIAFNYKDFAIPDTLFNGSIRWEMEWLAEAKGSKYVWDDEFVTAEYDTYFSPIQSLNTNASNDSVVMLSFNINYSGKYNFEIKIDNLFPRRYLMVVRTSNSIGGLWDIYFNDVLVKEMDYYDFISNPWYYQSVTGEYYFPNKGLIRWDCWAINENPYGQASVRFEYKGPGSMPSHGILIDYIDFIPYD